MADKGYPMPMPAQAATNQLYPAVSQQYPPQPEHFTPVQPPPPYNEGLYKADAPPFAQSPPHQPHYQQHHQQVPQQRTIVSHVYAVAPSVGPDPSSLQCPSCRQSVVTRLDHEATTKTHIMAALLCCFICWPCAWLPYAMNSCKNANHYCPNCNAYIGTYQS